MFENLFAPYPRDAPLEFAAKLLLICSDPGMNDEFCDLLRLTGPQRKRYLFSTFIFTAMMPDTMASTAGKGVRLAPFLGMTHALMMNAWQPKMKDSLVRLGDYVLTINEYGYLAEAIGERWFQDGIPIERVMDYQIRFGTLVSQISFIRGKQQIEDFNEVFASATREQFADNLAIKYGVQLMSYILGGGFVEDSFDRGLSREQILSHSMIFASLAGTYCRRISAVYRTAIPAIIGG